jgi:hypothetical protein
MAAYLIDLFWVEPPRQLDRHGKVEFRLEPTRASNELDYPVLLMLRDGDKEYIVEVRTTTGTVDTHGGLGEYLKRLRERAGETDLVVTAHGMYPFRA